MNKKMYSIYLKKKVFTDTFDQFSGSLFQQYKKVLIYFQNILLTPNFSPVVYKY